MTVLRYNRQPSRHWINTASLLFTVHSYSAQFLSAESPAAPTSGSSSLLHRIVRLRVFESHHSKNGSCGGAHRSHKQQKQPWQPAERRRRRRRVTEADTIQWTFIQWSETVAHYNKKQQIKLRSISNSVLRCFTASWPSSFSSSVYYIIISSSARACYRNTDRWIIIVRLAKSPSVGVVVLVLCASDTFASGYTRNKFYTIIV